LKAERALSLSGNPSAKLKPAPSDREIVRAEFYAQTAADGTPAQKGEFRRKQFNRALDWTEQQKLVGVRELEGITYLWLSNPRSEDNTNQSDDL